MKKNKIKTEFGFTLIELIVVIAIMGVIAAITVPTLTGYLDNSKENAYEADKRKIQIAVNSNYSKLSNTKFIGKRQYPIWGQSNKGTENALKSTSANSSEITTLGTGLKSNPLGGTIGCTPSWTDDSNNDGTRINQTSESLYYRNIGIASEHWNTVQITRGETEYEIDSRDCFINFEFLIGKEIDELPKSASKDNHQSKGDGSYSWYIDDKGQVQSLFFYYPTLVKKGYQGVYP
tara:strand:+ start:127 stop:828 length:702 start_codon:yes stop_codon:yes gene_type:complete